MAYIRDELTSADLRSAWISWSGLSLDHVVLVPAAAFITGVYTSEKYDEKVSNLTQIVHKVVR